MQVYKYIIKSTGIEFFTFYATTCAEKCNNQLVVATTGAFKLTSVITSGLLFADNCVLYRNIYSIRDCLTLQEDLTSLGQWEADWQIKFNEAKCHSMRVTRHQHHKHKFLCSSDHMLYSHGCILRFMAEKKSFPLFLIISPILSRTH